MILPIYEELMPDDCFIDKSKTSVDRNRALVITTDLKMDLAYSRSWSPINQRLQ